MRYLESPELRSFHDSFLRAIRKSSLGQSDKEWGYPHGVERCETFSFPIEQGTLLIGHLDRAKEWRRWWIPVALVDRAHATYSQLAIDFEMSIPAQPNLYLSVHYAVDGEAILILHKGKFTVGHGSIRLHQFFEHYRANPKGWQTIRFNGYDYLVLARLVQTSFDKDFLGLLD